MPTSLPLSRQAFMAISRTASTAGSRSSQPPAPGCGEGAPGFANGAACEPRGADPLPPQPPGQGGLVGRPLTADADVLAPRQTGLYGHLQDGEHGRIALVEAAGDQARGAVEA